MSRDYNETEIIILNALLDKYEGSKSFTAENLVNQSFSVKPDFLMPSYSSDFADIDEVSELNYIIGRMEADGLVKVKRKAEVISSIVAVENRIDDYYKIVGRIRKDELAQLRLEKYLSLKGRHVLIDRFIDAEIQRLSAGYKCFLKDEELADFISLLNFILNNTSEILERELSILVLGDSKLFEKKYRHKICRALSDYSDSAAASQTLEGADTRLWEIETLADYFVVPNPSYIFFKGCGTICFESGRRLELYPDLPLAISSQSLDSCTAFRISCNSVMTVENLTSFNRMSCDDRFLIYLEGYHSKSKQRLLNLIFSDNPDLKFLHFGDIDPDGFMILHNLRNKTGIDFAPYRMGPEELIANKKAWKELTDSDIKRAESLLALGLYCDSLEFMLKNNCKLEQEIIAFSSHPIMLY